jgi:hypothetical protein
LPAELFGRGVVFGDWSVFDRYGLLVFFLIVGLVVGSAAIHAWGEIYTARKLSPEDRRKQASRRLNPLCRGEEPSRVNVMTILVLPFIAFDRWLVARAYGGPYNCDCPPEEFGQHIGGGGKRT